MNIPEQYKYTKEHEWLQLDDTTATIGITQHAAEQLGDVVFVELPEIGDNVAAGDTFGTVESVKAVSDLFAPVSGEIVAINTQLENAPEMVNQEPYGDGWMVKIKMSTSKDLDDLLSASEYGDLEL